MKHYILFSLFLMPISIIAIETCTIVGKKAPDFKTEAVINGEVKDISLADYDGKNKILIFYPADFSFICPTELFAFQEKLPEFEKQNTVLIGISVDQIYSHQKWLETPRKEGGIQGVSYPIATDVTKKIARDYGVLDEEKGIALRGIFIIDTDNIVQAASVYNTSTGRSTDEVMRVLEAILFTKEHGHVCPVNWKKGQEGMEASKPGLLQYIKEES
jgi:peroxiredoxin 2/4